MPESPLFAVPMLEGGSDYPTPDSAADAKDINDMFKYAENFWGVLPVTSGSLPSSPKDQQLVHETDTGRLRYWDNPAWVTIVPDRDKGTTAERDALYPAPGSPTDRVALANTFPLWFNTQKGYQEQYYAQFDDSGATALTPTKKTFGWAPALTSGRVPLLNWGALGTGVKHGAVQAWPATGTLMGFESIFLNYPEFEAIEFEFIYDTATSSADQAMLFRNSGADVATAQYFYAMTDSGAGTVLPYSGGPVAGGSNLAGRTSVGGGINTLTVYGARDTTKMTTWKSYSVDNDGFWRQAHGRFATAATIFEGIRLNTTTGTFGICRARAFGISIADS